MILVMTSMTFHPPLEKRMHIFVHHSPIRVMFMQLLCVPLLCLYAECNLEHPCKSQVGHQLLLAVIIADPTHQIIALCLIHGLPFTASAQLHCFFSLISPLVAMVKMVALCKE